MMGERARGVVLVLATLAAVAVPGCKRSGPTAHAVAGSITLTGVLRDGSGTTVGTRIVTNADGIRVFLVGPSGVVDSTLTVAGAFRLVGSEDRNYRVMVRTGPVRLVSSGYFAIGRNTDVALAQPLELGSAGSLGLSPSPFTTTVQADFTLAATGNVGVSVFSLNNLRVRTLANQSFTAGAHAVVWDGLDDLSQVAPDGPYWIAYSGDGNEWAELVFKGP